MSTIRTTNHLFIQWLANYQSTLRLIKEPELKVLDYSLDDPVELYQTPPRLEVIEVINQCALIYYLDAIIKEDAKPYAFTDPSSQIFYNYTPQGGDWWRYLAERWYNFTQTNLTR